MINIKALRKKNGISQIDLAKIANVDQTAVSRWELGKSMPDPNTLALLADHFGVSVDQILGRESLDGPRFTKRVEEAIKKLKPAEIQSLPMLGNIAAGKPIMANEEHEFLIESTIRADFCLRVQGDSMIGAGILNGDVVFIRRQPMVNNGEIAAVLIDDEATLKRVYTTNDLISLIAENPAYPPIIYKENDGHDILILGKAVGLSRLFIY